MPVIRIIVASPARIVYNKTVILSRPVQADYWHAGESGRDK